MPMEFRLALGGAGGGVDCVVLHVLAWEARCALWILYLLSCGTYMIATSFGPCLAQVYFPFLIQSGGQ